MGPSMIKRPTPPTDVARLVDNMFSEVLTPQERAELLVWIHEWEDAHPDVDAAHRVTGWIDVAYAYQARARRTPAPDPEPDTEPDPPAEVAARTGRGA